MPWISGGNEPAPRMPIGAVMIPMEINAYPREVITNGVNKNGIKSITFNITGIPKTTGSFTPKRPLGNTIFENYL